MSFKQNILVFIFVFSIQMFAQSGMQFELNSIKFSGNNSFSSSTLQDVIYSQPTPWWFWKFLNSFTSLGKEPVYFDSTNIQIDLNALRDYYNSNGFFNASFSYKYEIDTAHKKVDLAYLIYENRPFTFGKLKLTGLDNLPRILYDNIYGDISLDTTKRFSERIIQDNTNKVISDLRNNGYMFAKYNDTTIIIKDTAHLKADVDIFFSLGNNYVIDTILINKTGEGAHLVEDGLLRDISGIKSGETYDLDELRRSTVRLYRTGLFNSVLLSGAENDTTDSKVPIRLDGTIGLMNELSPEVILNNQQSAFNVGLGFSYIRKNFLGDARKLTISSSFGVQDIFRADFNNFVRKFSFRDTTLLGYVDSRIIIDQPYVFEKPIFGTWETYATINKQQDYNNTVYGSKVTLEFELPTYTFINHLSTSYTVEQSNEVYRTYNDSLSTKLISDIAADAASTTADNILFPTRGYNLSFHVEEGNSFRQKNSGAAGFYKLQIGGSYYISLDRTLNSIAAFKLKLGNIQVFYGNFSSVPINRTFYAGGSTSIRGWRSNELVPEGSQIVSGIQGTSFVGGSFLIEGSFEYRHRFLENLGFALFTDYGNTWLGYNQFSWNGLAIATGLGFRYYTPVAPFRIDLAVKFYDPKNKSFIWQNWNQHFFNNIELNFGLGEAF
ncbi:MAG: BamA/TamA family outer membrane protein [Bacteroidetes bacterium]|nr:BamA/TamA family outer membrane protein [Bacteroidota bacterium]